MSDRITTNFEREFVYTLFETADAREFDDALRQLDAIGGEYKAVVLDFVHRRSLEFADYGFILRLCDHVRKSGLNIRMINCNAGIRDRFIKLNFDRFATIE